MHSTLAQNEERQTDSTLASENITFLSPYSFPKLLFLTVILSVITINLTLWVTSSYIEHHERIQLREDIDQRVYQLLVQTIESGSMGAAALLGLMDQSIKDISLGNLPVDAPEVLQQLNIIKKRFSASSVFVMDLEGTIIAYSTGKKSSTGVNASFRPYFQQAKRGISNLYPAVGSNSGKRGFYFAAPVYKGNEPQGEIIGVVVIKQGLKRLDRLLHSLKTPVLLMSPQNMIFASSPDSWRNKMLGKVTHQRWQDINKSLQFGRQFEQSPPQSITLDLNQASVVYQQKVYAIAQQTYSWNGLSGNWKMILLKDSSQWFPVSWKIGISLLESLFIFISLLLLMTKSNQRKERIEHQEQTLQLSTAIEQSPVSIYMTNLQGEIQYTNPKFRELTGYCDEEILGQTPDFLAPNLAHYGSHKRLMSKIKLGKTWQGELYNQAKNGDNFWEYVSISPVKNPQNNIIQFIAICENISEQKASQKHLAKAKKDAEHANRMKSEFLANMSHEIRTPMNGLSGMLSLLQQTPLQDNQKDYIHNAQISADALLSLLNDILDLSRVEVGKLDLEHITFDPQRILEQIVSLHAPLIDNKNITFNCYIEPGSSRQVYGDPKRLTQIITNLLSNAIKFTHEGYISIFLSFPTLNETKTEIQCQIKDSGIGISKSMHHYIFDLFTQADGSNTRQYGGTGLGLNIVKQLINLMRGDIWVDSDTNKGSSFTFKIPLNSVSIRLASPQTPQNTPFIVLVSSENKEQANHINAWMTYWGHQVKLLTIQENALHEAQLIRQQTGQRILIILDASRLQQTPKLKDYILDQTLSHSRLLVIQSSNKPLDHHDFKYLSYLARPIIPSRLEKICQIFSQTSLPIIHSKKQPSRQYNECVLIVEDNPINQLVLQEQLKQHGIQTNVANNGKEALVLFKQNTYALIFMDCEMPEIDGFETSRMICDIEENHQKKHTPIIALTAHAMSGYREKCLASKMDDYLSKPLSYEDLGIKLDVWLRKIPNKESLDELDNPLAD